MTTSGAADRTARQTWTVEGAATTGGRAATRVALAETVSAAGVPDETFAGAVYLTLAEEAVEVLATEARFDGSAGEVTQTLSMSPARPELDFSLAKGEARSLLSVATLSFAPAATAPAPFAGTTRIVFDGFENVTVPAGTFANACKFTVDLMTSGQLQTTQWVARGSGVLLRSDTASESQQLVSASVDGTAVKP